MAHPSWFRSLASRVAKREGKKESAVNVATASEVIPIVCEAMAEDTLDGGDLVGRMMWLGFDRRSARLKARKRKR